MATIIKKTNYNDVVEGVIRLLRSCSIVCYDKVPANQPFPLSWVELVSQEVDESKTFSADRYTLWIHSLGSLESTEQINDRMSAILQALSEKEVSIKPPGILFSQELTGLVQLFEDEGNLSKHGVQEVKLLIAHGHEDKT